MSISQKRKPKRAPASRRLETRSAGPTVTVVRTDRHALLPHERDQAAIPEPRKSVARNRKPIRQATRDINRGLSDTEARGTPTNIPVQRRTRRQKRRSG